MQVLIQTSKCNDLCTITIQSENSISTPNMIKALKSIIEALDKQVADGMVTNVVAQDANETDAL